MSLQHPLEAGRLAQATKKADTAGETDSSKVPRQVNTGQVSQPYKDLSLEEGVVELCRAHAVKWHVEGSTLSTLWTRCPSPPDPLTSEFLPGRGVLSPSHPLTNPVMEPPPKCLWAPLDSILYTLCSEAERPGSTSATVSIPTEQAGSCQRREEGAAAGETQFSHPAARQAWVQIQHFMSKGHLSFQSPTPWC